MLTDAQMQTLAVQRLRRNGDGHNRKRWDRADDYPRMKDEVTSTAGRIAAPRK